MNKYIKPLILANLFVICLTNCSLTPSRQVDLQKLADSLPALPNPNKNLRNSPTLNANPPWLKKLVETAREIGKDEEVSLFPDGMMRNYVPARQPSKKFVKITSSYDVRGDSGVSSEKLNKRLKGKLNGKGNVIIQAGKKNNIDPLFLYGIIVQESGYGVSDYTNKYSNCMGRLYRDKKSGKWLPIKFNSVDECIEKSAEHLRINYIGQNLYTISAIKSKYCPDVTNRKSKDFNDKRGVNSVWKNSIIKHMNNAQI